MSRIVGQRKQIAVTNTCNAWKYLALAFAFAWTSWIVALRLHASEMMLNIGVAGPAFAALLLSRPFSAVVQRRFALGRILLFTLAVAACSVILSLYYAWRTGSDLSFRWNPWALIPAILPAWILCSIRSSGRREVNDPVSSIMRFTPWSFVALLIFPGMILFGVIVGHGLHQPLVPPQGHGSLAKDIAFAAVFFAYNVVFAGILEEPGWRGTLLVCLQARWSPLASSFLVWLPWALWHAPLDISRPGGFSLLLFFETRIIFLVPISLILTWLYNKGKGSVQTTVLFHASINTFPFVLPYWMPAFTLLFAIAGIAVVSDRMWRKSTH
jgi:membrane protease YdiL (CAAX protease family)